MKSTSDPAPASTTAPGAARIDAQLWPALSAKFDEALALPAAEREPMCAGLAEQQPALADALRRMLAAHASAQAADSAHLSLPDAALLDAALAASRWAPQPGDRLGSYRLIEQVGQGGMASVWRAQQTQGVLREVALKLPLLGLETAAATAARFAQERDLMAQLEHPHIARLYDAGITERGQPYLAMELIAGQPITAHARSRGLSLRRRLVLFLQVLSGLSFAHGRLVNHRDLKPSNLLVTPEGQAKLLDFGIAQGDGEAQPQSTGAACTPDGASPEQLAGAPPAATSDVYAAGVVLYELLTDRRPYVLDRHSAVPLAQQLAALRVPPPSAAAAGSDCRRELAGDLDAIVARAMALDPAQRYPSAESLAADLLRYLDLQPVQARQGGRAYVVGRFIRRNRLLLGAAAGVLLALSLGLAAALWQSDQARTQAQRAQAAQRFLLQLFDASRPELARGRDVSARELLDQGAQRLEAELPDQPALRAELHREIGRIYISLGANAPARLQIDQALGLYGKLNQLQTEDAIDTQFLLFELLKEEMQFDAARAAAQLTLKRAEAAFGSQHRWRLPVTEHLAWMAREQGDSTHAEALLKPVIAPLAGLQGMAAVQQLKLRSVLANVMLDQARYAEAREQFSAVVEGSRVIADYEQTDALADRYNLARARYALAEFAATAALLAEVLPATERHLGAAHDRTLKARALWAQSLSELGEHAQAIELQRSNLNLAATRATVDDDVLSLQRLTLAKLLRAGGRYAEGVPLARQGRAFFDGKYPQPTWLRERGRWVLAELLLGAGQVDEALSSFSLAQVNAQHLQGYQQNILYADLLQSRALALHGRGRTSDAAQAQALLAEAHAIYVQAQGEQSTPAQRAKLHLLWLQALQQPDDDAAATALEAGLATWQRRPRGTAAPDLADAGVALMRAAWLARAGRAQQAAQEQLRGAALWRRALGQAWPGVFTGLQG